MEYKYDSLNRLFEKIKTIGFFERLFKWGNVKNLLIDSINDLQKLIINIDHLNQNKITLEGEISSQTKDIKLASEALLKKEIQIERLESTIRDSGSRAEKLTGDLARISATVEAQKSQIDSLLSDSRLLTEKNSNLIAENKKLSENIATSTQTVSELSKRKSELDIELAELKKDLQSISENVDDRNSKIEKLTADCAGILSRVDSQRQQIDTLLSDNRLLTEKNTNLIAQNKAFAEEAATNTQTISELSKRKIELDNELIEIRKELQMTQGQLSEKVRQNTQLIKEEEFRKQEHSNSLASLEKIREQIQLERKKEVDDKNEIEIERLKNLKETWKKHQDNAKSIVKAISQKHTIQYVDAVPFKGDPDNTLMICDEFVVFDAKSPGGENLANFSNYLKDQAEKAKKYAKQANVKTDIFFVVPSNTLDYINSFVYKHGDHNVYIISMDALEPVILSLKKIEDYEFVDQLSPEDRENICRILGRFAHLSKRRIQVDSFFAKQFIELAYKCETDLQPDILKTVVEFEKSEKLNPPLEKRAKAIPLSEIEIESKKINQEAGIRGILIQDENISNLLNELPLYKSTNE